MLRRLSISEMWGIVIDHIQERTETKVVSEAKGEKSPFFYVEFTTGEPRNTKTQFIDHFEFAIHAISEETHPYTAVPVLEMVKELEEIMTDEVEIPEPFFLVNQEYEGVNTVKKDPSDEGHAVLSYTFDISYGFRTK